MIKISPQQLRKIDTFLVGFLIGLIAPIIIFFAYYKLNYDFHYNSIVL
jgi:hypothetical protein